MSAPSDSAGRPSPCACTNIALMQLFHELKQKFPAVPDHVVSNTIELYCHDKAACETHLHSEAKASLTHAYHASSVAAARKHNELCVSPALKCPNQAIIKDRVQSPIAVKSVSCPEPQTAQISSRTTSYESEEEKSTSSTPKVKIDGNQNIVETRVDDEIRKELPSPVTIINIDNCYAKYSKESPSDIESTSEELNAININSDSNEEQPEPESTNYKILKSNKIKHNLNETLESVKDKTKINDEGSKSKESVTPLSPLHQITDKPKRPNTLDFKPNPDIAFKQTLPKPETQANNFDSPATSAPKAVIKETPNNSYWVDHGCPVNLSVNVNCHMDYNRGYDPWIENFDSPRTVTSVNLTVCTPTSNMASPIRDARDDDGRFEGQVTVTVSPSSGPQIRRRAPPPPPTAQSRTQLTEPQKNYSRGPTEAINQGRSLIERQKERLGRLAAAIAQEKVRLSQLTRETHILAGPTPSPAATRRLRDYVHRLRDQCDGLAKKLEMCGNEPDSLDFYRHIYTGQPIAVTTGRRPGRPAPPPPDEAPSWECHVCTFRNHGLLDKCEECEMPRILVGTSPSRTLDSGFGSFRDSSRRVNTQIGDDVSPFSADVPDPQFSAAC